MVFVLVVALCAATVVGKQMDFEPLQNIRWLPGTTTTTTTDPTAAVVAQIAQGAVTDSVGDSTDNGADLYQLAWTASAELLELTVTFAGAFSATNAATIYLEQLYTSDGASCPGAPTAEYAIVVANTQSTLYVVGPDCKDRTFVANLTVRAAVDGWVVEVTANDFGFPIAGQFRVRVLGGTSYSVATSYQIQDYLPNETLEQYVINIS